MLLVKTQIGLSEVYGIGLFAAQFIAKGDLADAVLMNYLCHLTVFL